MPLQIKAKRIHCRLVEIDFGWVQLQVSPDHQNRLRTIRIDDVFDIDAQRVLVRYHMNLMTKAVGNLLISGRTGDVAYWPEADYLRAFPNVCSWLRTGSSSHLPRPPILTQCRSH
ncbi:hypothetical protein [Bradyrhizobium sp. BR 10289]|uniref:hypothetical protein n=1 Tax=Bradyrhizobium sp. BR 10289 TaxID=2749993 RepID=UPI001C64689B|nr:hypothetical protein [Bradyrhizobium sp. BR 10289]MBW7972654.1 hypothetical protein [Bradyrhizobium sp. BR 10289]